VDDGVVLEGKRLVDRRRIMGVLAYSVWVKATPEQVWQTYADPSRIPDWQTGKPVIGEVRGGPGQAGSSYVSRRDPFSARPMVLSAEQPRELVTTSDAYLGLQLEVTSLLTARSGGTDLQLHVVTRWRRGLGPVGKLVELAILSPREAQKELANLKALVERHSPP
jgi:uncharacterized protein YndB with AHSA1/START domain